MGEKTNFTTTLRGRKIIAWLLVFSICLTSITYSEKYASASGYKAVWKYEGRNDTKIELSNKHNGWVSPDDGYKPHYNLKISIYNVPINNWHIYKRGKCLVAYDSVRKVYFAQKYKDKNCYPSNDKGIKQLAGNILKKTNQNDAQSELSKAGRVVSAAVVAAIVVWAVKIGATFLTGNPGFVLAPISLDDEDEYIEPSIDNIYLEPLEE